MHGLTTPFAAGTSVADVAGAVSGVHAQILSAAEVSAALRIEGATRADVRRALWDDRTVVKTFGPRGTVHLLPAPTSGAGWPRSARSRRAARSPRACG